MSKNNTNNINALINKGRNALVNFSTAHVELGSVLAEIRTNDVITNKYESFKAFCDTALHCESDYGIKASTCEQLANCSEFVWSTCEKAKEIPFYKAQALVKAGRKNRKALAEYIEKADLSASRETLSEGANTACGCSSKAKKVKEGNNAKVTKELLILQFTDYINALEKAHNEKNERAFSENIRKARKLIEQASK